MVECAHRHLRARTVDWQARQEAEHSQYAHAVTAHAARVVELQAELAAGLQRETTLAEMTEKAEQRVADAAHAQRGHIEAIRGDLDSAFDKQALHALKLSEAQSALSTKTATETARLAGVYALLAAATAWGAQLAVALAGFRKEAARELKRKEREVREVRKKAQHDAAAYKNTFLSSNIDDLYDMLKQETSPTSRSAESSPTGTPRGQGGGWTSGAGLGSPRGSPMGSPRLSLPALPRLSNTRPNSRGGRSDSRGDSPMWQKKPYLFDEPRRSNTL